MSLFGVKPVSSENPVCGVVIAAAGSSERMQGTDKLTALLAGKPVLARAIQPFQDCSLVGEIVVVARPDRVEEFTALCRENGLSKVTKVVPGGDERTDSVLAGLKALSHKMRLAAVHDGARPLVTGALVEALIRRGDACAAVAPALPVTDTVKIAEENRVTDTPDRENLRTVQTPQVFDRGLLEGALTKAKRAGQTCTDDCRAMELLGKTVYLLEGERENIKITAPSDLIVAAALWEARQCE